MSFECTNVTASQIRAKFHCLIANNVYLAMQVLDRMQFKMQCKVMATLMLALGSGQLVAAGRSLLQDAPTGVIMCDVAIVGGGPGEASLLYHARCL